MRRAIEEAYRKGYRVDGRGRVVGPRGVRRLRLKTSNRRHAGYLYFSVSIGENSHRKIMSIQVHRFAAYQRFGDRIFLPGVEVLHRGRSATDNRPSMLALGTRVENELEKPPEVRSRAAKKGWRTKRRKRCTSRRYSTASSCG